MDFESRHPVFEFTNGYRLRVSEVEDSIVLTLDHETEDGASIILPPNEVKRFLAWWQEAPVFDFNKDLQKMKVPLMQTLNRIEHTRPSKKGDKARLIELLVWLRKLK